MDQIKPTSDLMDQNQTNFISIRRPKSNWPHRVIDKGMKLFTFDIPDSLIPNPSFLNLMDQIKLNPNFDPT